MTKSFQIKLKFFILLPLAAIFGFFSTVSAQDSIPHTLQDSLVFAKNVHTWKVLPANKDSLFNWQVASVYAVMVEKTTVLQRLFTRDLQNASLETARISSLLDALKQDTTIAKDSINTIGKQLKQAQKTEKSAQKQAISVEEYLADLEKTRILDPILRRKSLGKAFKKALDLDKKYQDLHPELQPAPAPPVVAAPPPPLPDTLVASAEQDTASNAENRLALLRKKLKPKEKQPEKPKAVRYSPEKDVMLSPPKMPCTFATERKDAFSGVVYKETQMHELFRFSNAVMKKVLPEGQPHIICKAALSTDPQGGRLLLEFEIKDANARRSFGGLAPKSIASLRFMDGEMITLFNENAQEILFDQEKGVTTFKSSYIFQSTVLRKMEKTELDQIRIAWSTGYEDYNVHHVSLLQQLANCIK